MRMKMLAVVTAVTTVSLLLAGRAWSESRATDVPNGFFSFYGGFASAGNTNLKVTGLQGAPHIYAGHTYRWNVDNLSMKNSGWGGLGVGYWFKQMPVSIGASFTMDFFQTAIKSQTVPANYVWDNGVTAATPYTTSQRNLFQFVPGFNLIVGVPLKFVRPYAGAGPAIFMVRHDINYTNGKTASALDTKIGYNAFLGVEGFIARHFSVFGEVKYSEVRNLDFQPYPSTDPAYHNKYDKLTSQRIAVGGAFHF